MTSKNLFFKLIRQDVKKRIWCPILIFIAYFLLLEVRFLAEIEDFPEDYFYDIFTFVREYFFGSEVDLMFFAACVTAFVCGISGYTYLHSKAQIDTYHSLPVSRTQLFWSKYVSGVLQFFVPFVIHILICVGIAVGKHIFTAAAVSSILSYVGIQLVVFVLTYSVAVAATGLTGNMIISILGTGVLFIYSAVITVLSCELPGRFFRTYAEFGNRINFMLNERIWCFSPLSMILKLLSRPDSITLEEAQKVFKYNVSYVWVLAAAAVVYSLAAYIIYLKRDSETAGKAIVFGAAEPVIKTMVVIPGAFFFGFFFSSFSYKTDLDGWFLFGLIFGFIILCMLMEIIFRMDIHGALMHKKQFLFNAACTALIFIVFQYDVTGYDTYVPSDTQVQSCAVSITNLMPMSQSIEINARSNHYMSSDKYRMAHMEIQDNPSVMELARKAAKEKLAYRQFDYYEGIENDPEYMETMNRELNYRSVLFGYKLANGKKVYRQYIVDISDTDTFSLLSDIFGDSEYKLGSVPLFDDEWNVTFDIVNCESNFKRDDIMLTPNMQSKLIEVYQKEYLELTLDTVIKEIPVGMIEFARKSLYGGYVSYCDEMCIYPQFTETIALLKTYGFDMEDKLTAEDVDSIQVTKMAEDSGVRYYRKYNSYSSFEASVAEKQDTITEYTDKEQIQQILDSVINENISWQFDFGITDYFDGQYTIGIDSTQDNTVYGYRFIKDRIPDFVKISAKNN